MTLTHKMRTTLLEATSGGWTAGDRRTMLALARRGLITMHSYNTGVLTAAGWEAAR